MRPSARHAFLVLLLPFTSLFAQTGALPPALAALRSKADAGDAIAQYNLGVAYAQGREILADPVEAYVWLTLAAEHGTPGKAYETLLQEITPAQLAEGKRRLGLRKNAVATTAPAASPITLAPLDGPDRTAELTAKNQQLTAEVATLRTRLDEAATSAGRALVTAKADANAVADALDAKFSAAQAQSAQQIRTLTENVATLTAEKNALTAQLTQASAPKSDPNPVRIAALETQLATTKTDLTSALNKLTELTTQSTKSVTLEAELARATQRTSALQTEITTLTADRATLRQQLAEASRAPAPKPADDSAAKIAALNTQIASLTAAKASVEQKLATAEARLIAPLPAAVAATSSTPARNEELETAQAKLEAALRSFTLVQNENAQLKSSTEAAKKEAVEAANAKLESTLRSFTLSQTENAQLKSAAESAKTETATLRQQLADARTKLAAVPAPAPAKNDELVAANAKLETTLRSFSAAQTENAQLKSSAEATKTENVTLRQQLADARTKLAAVPAPAPTAPAKNEELAAANAKVETALRSFSLAQNENAQLKSAVEAAKTETATLRQQLADAQSKVSAAPTPVSTTVSTVDPVALQKQLKDTETKLSVALRTYVVIAAENDKLKSEAGARANSSTQAVAAVEARATAAATTQSAQLAEVRDQLRQVQAQSAAYAEENFQLRTRLATGGTTAASPSRTPDRVVPTAVPAAELVPAPVAAPAARTHTIVTGDTLLGLAKKYYSDPARWTEILAANNDVLGGKPTLPLGRTLRIP